MFVAFAPRPHRHPAAFPGLLLLAMMVVVTWFGGEPARASAPTDPGNAATWYQKAIDELSGLSPDIRRPVDDWDRRSPPSDRIRRSLSRHERVFDLTARGAGCRWCDFELDYDAGFEMTLPHLGQLRAIQRLLAGRAAVAIMDGRPAAAVADIERIRAIGLHVAGDGILISSLVGMAGAALADELVELGFSRGVFGPQEAADLLGRTRTLAGPDAFATRSAVAMERRIGGQWLRQVLLERGADERRALLTMMGLVTAGDAEPEFLGRAGEAGLESELDLLDASYAVMDEAFAVMGEDPEAAIASLAIWEEELSAGEFGQLAMLVVPAVNRVLDQAITARTRHGDREGMLRAVIRGDAGAITLDGAVHLREAIALAADMPGDAVDLLKVGAALPETQAEARAAWDRCLGQLAAAAAADVIDEGVLRVAGDSMVVPAWASGARRVLHMLAGAASERLNAGDAPEAVRLATIGVSLAAGLVDPRGSAGCLPIASRLAQEHLEGLMPVLQGLPAPVRQDPAIFEPLVSAADRLVVNDPQGGGHHARLGYATMAERLQAPARQIVSDLRRRAVGSAPKDASNEDPLDLDVDQLAVLLLVGERIAGAVGEPLSPLPSDAPDVAGDSADGLAAADRLPSIAGLEGLMDAEAMQALQTRVAEIRREVAAAERSLAEVLGPEPSPLDLRAAGRVAGRLVRSVHQAIDPERRWSAESAAAGAGADGAAGAH